jgi:putative ABC transport system permease protein
MIKNYLKIALRNLYKHKVFTLINIIGLAIGISGALTIFLIVNYDFGFDRFHANGDRIYRVVSNYSFYGEKAYNSGVTAALPPAVKGEIRGIEIAAPFQTMHQPTAIIENGTNATSKFKNQDNIILADARYFDIFIYKWLAGTAKTALNAPYQVVLTADQAKKYFPSLAYSQILGKQVIYEDTIKTTVTGIVANYMENTDFKFHDFISYSTIKSVKTLKDRMQDDNWGSTQSGSQFFIQLAGNIPAANVERQLNDLLKRHKAPSDASETHNFALQPLKDIHFNSDYGVYDTGRLANKTTLYSLLAVAAFLLLLGCINFINLTTAQASQRAKEIGIRKTLGSTRRQLITQILSETFITTLLASMLAMGLCPLILKTFADFVPEDVSADFTRPIVLLFLIALISVVSLLSGFYPAIVLSGFKPVVILKNQVSTRLDKTRSAWLRKSLTVTQFFIAQFFIMCTLLVSKQIHYVLNKDLGFKKDAIVIINTPYKSSNANNKQAFVNKLAAIPQIALVSVGGAPPAAGGSNSTEAGYNDGKKEYKIEIEKKFGDINYLDVYHLKLLAGRNLRAGDTTTSILINATAAKALGFKNPSSANGKFIKYSGSETMQVAGVLADFYPKSLREPIKPLAVLLPGKYNNRTLHIALKPQTASGNEWAQAITGIQQVWKEIYSDDDFDYKFFDKSIANFYESEQRTSKLLVWATGLSILISCLGLLGLTIYTTELRVKEIGIRKVLGASISQIVRLLSTELTLLVLLSFLIVCPLAWWAMNKWMQNFVERTQISWWIFILSGLGMLLMALLTQSFQTIKATLANPVKSLRSE